MKSFSPRFKVVLLILLSFVLFIRVVGCTEAQWAGIADGARGVQRITSSNAPATQSAGEHFARAGLHLAAAVYPPLGELMSYVAMLSGAVAGYAGHVVGVKRGRRQLKPVITEMIEDVDTLKDEFTPFSPRTTAELVKLGHGDFASVSGELE